MIDGLKQITGNQHTHKHTHTQSIHIQIHIKQIVDCITHSLKKHIHGVGGGGGGERERVMNYLMLNVSKTKELVTDFRQKSSYLPDLLPRVKRLNV